MKICTGCRDKFWTKSQRHKLDIDNRERALKYVRDIVRRNDAVLVMFPDEHGKRAFVTLKSNANAGEIHATGRFDAVWVPTWELGHALAEEVLKLH